MPVRRSFRWALASTYLTDTLFDAPGEHGIGTTKRKYLREELGEGTLALMRRIKRELDPLGLLNPGKVLYETEEEELASTT